MDRTDIENALLTIGMPVRLSGFKYITDVVSLLDQPEWKNPKWTALYYCVASNNNTTVDVVEAAIRYAFKTTRNKNHDYEQIEYYIGYSNCENSNSLMQLYNRLKCKCKKKDINLTKLMLRETLMELFNT